jgi:hypothetical protein
VLNFAIFSNNVGLEIYVLKFAVYFVPLSPEYT